jgi:hypothetical protein
MTEIGSADLVDEPQPRDDHVHPSLPPRRASVMLAPQARLTDTEQDEALHDFSTNDEDGPKTWTRLFVSRYLSKVTAVDLSRTYMIPPSTRLTRLLLLYATVEMVLSSTRRAFGAFSQPRVRFL